METSQEISSLKYRSNQTSAVTALSCFIVGCLAGQGLIEVNRDRDNSSQDLFEAIWVVCDCLTSYDVEIVDAHPVPIVQPHRDR